jgi:ribosomal protein S18 acetylase RimI-like enzyme
MTPTVAKGGMLIRSAVMVRSLELTRVVGRGSLQRHLVQDDEHISPSGTGLGSFPSSRCRVDNPVRYSPRMRVEVQEVRQVTDELVDAAGRLLPQLSRSAAPLDADDLTRIAGHQAISLFIARSGGVIVGMLTLVTFPLPSGLRARIEDVVVDQDARGQGVGTALTMAAVNLAQQQGARSIDLTSRASRVAANRLYQQLGFQLRDSNVYRYQPRPPDPWLHPAR